MCAQSACPWLWPSMASRRTQPRVLSLAKLRYGGRRYPDRQAGRQVLLGGIPTAPPHPSLSRGHGDPEALAWVCHGLRSENTGTTDSHRASVTCYWRELHCANEINLLIPSSRAYSSASLSSDTVLSKCLCEGSRT